MNGIFYVFGQSAFSTWHSASRREAVNSRTANDESA